MYNLDVAKAKASLINCKKGVIEIHLPAPLTTPPVKEICGVFEYFQSLHPLLLYVIPAKGIA